MSGYLLDTSILSAVAPGKPPLPASAAAWLRQEADRLYVPTLALQEIRKGIAKLDRAGGHERAARLLEWLHSLIEHYAERIVPLDTEAALAAGLLEDKAVANGRAPGLGDILIAATAESRSLTVLTANMKHFEPLGVDCLNPLVEQPS